MLLQPNRPDLGNRCQRGGLRASSISSCDMQQAGEGRYRVLDDIALPSLESVVKSSSRLPTLKSIVFTSVPVLGSSTAALSLLLGNVVKCSLLEELVLYKCGMVSRLLLAIDDHLHCWPRLTFYSGCGRTTSATLPMIRHGSSFMLLMLMVALI